MLSNVTRSGIIRAIGLEIVEGICSEFEKLEPAANNPAMTRQDKAEYLELKTHVADRPGHDRHPHQTHPPERASA